MSDPSNLPSTLQFTFTDRQILAANYSTVFSNIQCYHQYNHHKFHLLLTCNCSPAATPPKYLMLHQLFRVSFLQFTILLSTTNRTPNIIKSYLCSILRSTSVVTRLYASTPILFPLTSAPPTSSNCSTHHQFSSTTQTTDLLNCTPHTTLPIRRIIQRFSTHMPTTIPTLLHRHPPTYSICTSPPLHPPLPLHPTIPHLYILSQSNFS